MKTLFKCILLFLLISLVWHSTPLADLEIVYTSHHDGYEWLISNMLVIGVVFFAVALMIVIFLSLFAGVVFFAGLVCATMVLLGVSMFWPLLLAGILLYWIFSEKKSTRFSN